MPQVRITSTARIADAFGTHDPDDVVRNPSAALVALAQSNMLDPDTGLPYCEIVPESVPAPESVADATDATEEEPA